MKLSIQSFLTSCALVASLATPSLSQSRFVKSEDFGQKLGRAKKDHHIEANLFAGPFAFKYIGYSIAYGYIFDEGLGEVNIPFSIQPFGFAPTNETGKDYIDPSNLVIGTGLKIRKFKDQIDEGLFYGGGLRVWHIITKYDRDTGQDEPVEFEFSYQNWSPLGEIGYTQKFSTEWGANYSLELGGSFSTYEELAENTSDDKTDNPGDPGHTPAFDYTGLYYAVNVGAFYSF